MFRRSARKYSLYNKNTGSGFKLFVFGLLVGAAAVLAFFYLRQSPEPIQLVVGTPAPSQEQKPEEQVWSESGNVGITELMAGALIKSPLSITGTARLPNNEVYLRLKSVNKDKKGAVTEDVLVETVVEAKSQETDYYGTFLAELNFKPPAGTGIKDGVLEIFSLNAKDKTETDKLSMPVKFAR
ncbi:MAG: hypothetical protein Q8M83_04785 [bacterium]|nr:hypothetical protein [bacterium]